MHEISIKFDDMKIDETKKFAVKSNKKIIFNNLIFNKNVISGVEVDRNKTSLFLNLFSKNTLVATVLMPKDFIIETDVQTYRIYEEVQTDE